MVDVVESTEGKFIVQPDQKFRVVAVRDSDGERIVAEAGLTAEAAARICGTLSVPTGWRLVTEDDPSDGDSRGGKATE